MGSSFQEIASWQVMPLDFGRLFIERLPSEVRRPRILLPVAACLLRMEDRLVLIDAGFDPGLEARVDRVTWHRPELLPREQLAAVGLSEDDITDVILTHLHDDHASGILDRESGLAVYPNAQVHLQDIALFKGMERAAMGGERFVSAELLDFIATDDRTVIHHGDWNLGAAQILHTGGHTPGHQIVYAGSAQLSRGVQGEIQTDEKFVDGLFFAGDLISMRACLDPTFRTSSDVDPDVAMARRQELAQMGRTFFLFHAQAATRFHCHLIQ